MHVFIGYDPRQPLAANVARSSVERHASKPVAFTSLILRQLPITRKGATEFSYSRFLVPYLSGFQGYSVFMDEDQAVTGDIIELESLEGDCDCWVMQDQPKYEWASVIVFNNAKLQHMTPEFVQDEKNALFDFSWARNVGHLPAEWNHCCGYREPRTDAKLYHYTQGIPYWPECRGLPEDKIWFQEYDAMLESVDWIDLHQNTRHFGPVMNRHLKKYGIDANFRMKDQ